MLAPVLDFSPWHIHMDGFGKLAFTLYTLYRKKRMRFGKHINGMRIAWVVEEECSSGCSWGGQDPLVGCSYKVY